MSTIFKSRVLTFLKLIGLKILHPHADIIVSVDNLNEMKDVEQWNFWVFPEMVSYEYQNIYIKMSYYN